LVKPEFEGILERNGICLEEGRALEQLKRDEMVKDFDGKG